MANKKKYARLRKTPFPLSIRKGVINDFEKMCQELEIDKNEMAESLFKEFIKQRVQKI